MKYLKMDETLADQLCYADRKTDTSDDENYKQSRKVWPCDVCGKEFRYPYTLLRHMPIHTKERKFKCDKCPKAFRQMSTLSQHKATHSSAKPYACGACGKSFNRGSTLISHRRTHQEVKRFACNICHKAFHQKGNLVNHIYTHTNERPYRCDICLKGFNQKSNLVCHMYTVHGKKKSYSCDFCPASFSRENAYRTHVNNSHRVGTMPIVENDLATSFDDEMKNIVTTEDDRILEDYLYDNDNSEGHTVRFDKICIEEISINNSNNDTLLQDSNRFNAANITINDNKTAKKQGLKIPALPNSRILTDITNKMMNSEAKGLCRNHTEITLASLKNISFQENSTKGVIAETVITDMGRNLVVREKPPCVLEEVRSRGKTPFLLVVEHGHPPRLCKASLGTEGFIVSPVTSMDIERLSTSKEFQIPIVMTIRRILDSNESLKTFILIHQKPIELNILQALPASLKNESTQADVNASDQEYNEPLCIKVENSTESSTATSEKLNNCREIFNTAKISVRTTPVKRTPSSESDNMIRLHLSQVGETGMDNRIRGTDDSQIEPLQLVKKEEMQYGHDEDSTLTPSRISKSEDDPWNIYDTESSQSKSSTNTTDEMSSVSISKLDRLSSPEQICQPNGVPLEIEIDDYLTKYYLKQQIEKNKLHVSAGISPLKTVIAPTKWSEDIEKKHVE